MIDWTLWRSFLAAIDTGSSSAAAQSLNLSQATLSRHIKSLEAQTGLSLFHRSVKGLEPTQDALRLIDEARSMSVSAQNLGVKALGGVGNLNGSVRLSASRIMASLVLPEILRDFRLINPQIQIEIVSSDEAQNLLRQDADIAIRMFTPTQQNLIARKLGDSPIGFYATQTYLERKGRPETINDLLHHDIIGFDSLDDMIKGFKTAGLSIGRDFFPYRTDDMVVHHQLILNSAGIGMVQAMIGVKIPNLVRLDLGAPLPVLPIWLVMHEAVKTNARIRCLADYLTKALAGLLRYK